MARTTKKLGWLATALVILGVAPGCAATYVRHESGSHLHYMGTCIDLVGLATPLMPLVLVDLPFSFVVDTLFFGYDGVAGVVRGAEEACPDPAVHRGPGEHRECPHQARVTVAEPNATPANAAPIAITGDMRASTR